LITSGVMAEACVVGMRYFYFLTDAQNESLQILIQRKTASLPPDEART
jgi:hypothetical protein